ncbi:MAG: prolyl oligopeptidase family serine peptidase [Clostridia bacterium]|nr:prolyl oligopeptidase family serine peptidase [Clostridia bacterium]
MKRYLEKVFSDIKIDEDITYAVLPGLDEPHEEREYKFDVYYSESDTEKKRRGIIVVHGGGFWAGDKKQPYIVTLCNLFAQYGYVSFSVDYRLFSRETRPEFCGGAPVAAVDIELLRKFLFENAEKFNLDTENLYISGGSAGGMGSLEAAKLYKGYNAMVNLWGTYKDAQCPTDFIPTFLVHGTVDKDVDYNFSVEFFKKLKENNIPCELITLEDAGHTAIHRLPDFEDKMIKFMNDFAK